MISCSCNTDWNENSLPRAIADRLASGHAEVSVSHLACVWRRASQADGERG